jgi:hypothetical protein
MSAAVIGGPVTWSVNRDGVGNRTYQIEYKVQTTDPVNDGPFTAMNASGLPGFGTTWVIGNDNDPFAWCTPQTTVKALAQKDGEVFRYWLVTCMFSTVPMIRCNTTPIEDPLSEPMKLSGSFIKYTKTVMHDIYGAPIMNSSKEPIWLERDFNRPSVVIQQNVAALALSSFAAQIDTVNDFPLWGLPARCIKLANASWERLLYGVCTFYYMRRFEFEIKYDTWDHYKELDRGTRVIKGQWEKDVNPPVWQRDMNCDGSKDDHYQRCLDARGNILNHVALDGKGNRNLTPFTKPAYILDKAHANGPLKLYSQSNLLALGIPTSL